MSTTLSTAVPVQPQQVAACANHTMVAAEWQCCACGLQVCTGCLAQRTLNNTIGYICPTCGGQVASTAPVEEAPPPFFYGDLSSAFAYPFLKSGIIYYLFGALFYWFCVQAAGFSHHGMFAAIPLIGYIYTYVLKVINTSADGDPHMPGWPTNLFGLIGTFFMILIMHILVFLPAVAYGVACIFWGAPLKLMYFPVCIGLFLLPMATLRVAIFDSLEALQPGEMIRSIKIAPTAYVTTVLLLLVMVTVKTGMEMAFSTIPIVGSICTGLVVFYFMLVEARILGLLYKTYQYKYNWLDDIA